MPMEIDEDGNYMFKGTIAFPQGNPGDNYTVTINDSSWQPIGYISDGYTTLGERVEKLERLIRVLADALGVNEDFLSSVTEGV